MTEITEGIVKPRLGTTIGVPGPAVASHLPEDLLEEHLQRFGILAAVGGGLWTFALLMHTIFGLRTAGASMPAWLPAVDLGGIAASAAAFAYLRYASHGCQTKTDAGLYYMLWNAAAVAALNATRLPAINPDQLSWNTVVILISSMSIPTTPAKMFLAAMAAASMDPLAVAIAHLVGVPVSSLENMVLAFLPNYACAAVAVVPSYALTRISRRLDQAHRLGSYQLVERLGQGGMGEVWRAKHRLLARPVAIKLIRPEVLGAGSNAEHRTLLQRFEREAQATAALSSPHTIRIFDFGAAQDGRFYYVMELLNGRDLESLVREFGPLPLERALYVLRQVAHSLAEAHARGMVHRDVKPANICLCRAGLDFDVVKVLDFGMVKVGAADMTLTADHLTGGTPAFMAPEVILGDRAVDRRADVYAFGGVAYYLLTGQLVFEAETPMKMLLDHLNTRPVAPSLRTELPIPKDVDDFVLACLEKDPERRPQDARELLRIVRRYSTDAWDVDAAKRWWEMHLPELSGALEASATTGRAAIGPFAAS
jgi:eukaryotic-like serine/threonine-protein kinase